MLLTSLKTIKSPFQMFRRFKFKRRLKSTGVLVDTDYVVFVNNVDPIHFHSRDELDDYLRSFRKENEIFKLQIFRVESYSL